jgi:hypothetical protein
MGYGLIILSPHGGNFSEDDRRFLLDVLWRDTILDGLCELTVLNLQPQDLDCRTLQQSIECGEISPEEFAAFCLEEGFSRQTDTQKDQSIARQFLDRKYGQRLFALQLPHDECEVREAYNLIVAFAKQHRLRVDDPQAGYEIDLERPGEFPPCWGLKPRSRFTIFGWLTGRK